MRWGVLVHVVLVLVVLPTGCRSDRSGEGAGRRTIRLATTTSVENTGLLEALLGPFAARTGIQVHVVAVGTGQALKLAENGDADMVVVHDVEAEKAFMEAGFGLHRTMLMRNDFVLVGPGGDPAVVRGLGVVEALRRIAGAKATFVSRGDDSGTHKAELRLWKQAGIVPSGEWYVEAGQGMRLTIQMAHEKLGYCLSDRGTFRFAEGRVELEVLVAGEPPLDNPYHAMVVNPERHPHVHHEEAMSLLAWLASEECQELIGGFGKDGVPLFVPAAEAVKR